MAEWHNPNNQSCPLNDLSRVSRNPKHVGIICTCPVPEKVVQNPASQLQVAYDGWPQEVKDEFWRRFGAACLWRGRSPERDPGGVEMLSNEVEEMAEMFYTHNKLEIDYHT